MARRRMARLASVPRWRSMGARLEGTPMPIPQASTALARYTVLDLTRVRAGPTCVRQLADWGANVVKVELPEHMEAGDALGGTGRISRTCTATSAPSPSTSSRAAASRCSAAWPPRPTWWWRTSAPM
jgi:hypothetical protein